MRRTLVVGAAVALCTSSAIGARVAPASRSLPASDQLPLARTVHPPIAPSSQELWLAPTAADRQRVGAPAFSALKAGIDAHKQGRHVEAVRRLATAVEDLGPLAGYALYYAAASKRDLGDLDEARTLLRRLQAPRPAGIGPPRGYLAEAAAIAEAAAADAQKDHAAALAIYGDLVTRKTATPDEIWLRMGRAALAGRDTDRASEIFARVYYEFPFSDLAAQARTELDRMRALEPLGRGNARYRLDLGRAQRLFGGRRYADAESAFTALRPYATGADRDLIALRLAETSVHRRRFQAAHKALGALIDEGPLQDEALYYYASTRRSQGATSDSVRTVRQLADRFPASPWTEEALNNLASAYIREDRPERADEVLRELYKKFPAGRHAEGAGWRIGWRAYRARRYEEAIAFFETTARQFPRSDYRPSFLYWSGRAHEAQGRLDTALARYTLTTADYLNTYYGRLAAERLAAQRRPVAPPTLQSAPTGPDTAWPGAPPSADTIRLLLALDLHDEALQEVRYLQRTGEDSPVLQATAAWIANRQGDLLTSVVAIKRAYPQYMASGGEALPVELHRLIFPVAFWDEIGAQATRWKLDRYLLAALIAQESGFDPQIESSARAVGLMQLLPSTARQYARRLRLGTYRRSMLTTPNTNLAMGSALLADLVQRFGDLHLALAAYNAGTARVARWVEERAGDSLDREEFIDDIPFAETRNYVRRILSTSQDYRRVYADAGRVARRPVGQTGERATR